MLCRSRAPVRQRPNWSTRCAAMPPRSAWRAGEKGVAELRTEIAAAERRRPPAAKRRRAWAGRPSASRAAAGDDTTLMQQHKANPVSRRLAATRGRASRGADRAGRSGQQIGAPPRPAGRCHANVDRRQTAAGRHSRAGDERRGSAVLGATAVTNTPNPAGQPSRSGAEPARSQAAQARRRGLANKMARIVWAMMTSGEAYRPAPAAA